MLRGKQHLIDYVIFINIQRLQMVTLVLSMYFQLVIALG